MPPPQANATITAVRGQGQRDDWDRNQGGDEGAPKFAGELRAYYREKADRVASGGAVDVITRRTLWVTTAELRRVGLLGAGAPADLDTDDVITFTPDGRPEASSPAIAVAASELAGASAVSTTRIDLEHG